MYFQIKIWNNSYLQNCPYSQKKSLDLYIRLSLKIYHKRNNDLIFSLAIERITQHGNYNFSLAKVQFKEKGN